MTVTLIAAVSENNVIGKDNELVWKLPNDMRFFKNTTWGNVVIMGRKTFEALGKKALPGRINIVVSKSSLKHEENVVIANSLDDAFFVAKHTDCEEVFIIGGGNIYSQTIELANKMLVTKVHATLEGDAFFPTIDTKQWKLQRHLFQPKDSKHAFDITFQWWTKL